MKKHKKIIIIVVGVLLIIALLFLIYFKTTFISKNEIKSIVATNMNVNSDVLYFESINFEFDKKIYEVEVYYNNRDYEYKIDAKKGNIIYTDYVKITNNNSNSNPNQSNGNNASNGGNANNINGTTPSITLDNAKTIALTDAGLDINSVKFTREELEHDNHTLVYELEFFAGTIEYDYEINANTGEIISFDRDSIYD